MYFVLIEPLPAVKKTEKEEERYVCDRVFFNYSDAEGFAKRQMLENPIKAYVAEVKTSEVVIVKHPGGK